MNDQQYHLAQANIARGRAALTHPLMAGFVDQLDHVNAVADRAPGFVWRLQTEDGNATAIQAFDDPLIIFNMSVWESVEALHDYVFQSDHRDPLQDRRQWFTRLERPHSVLWWVEAGVRPAVDDARRRLDLLEALGPHAEAFTFATLLDPDGNPIPRGSRMNRECGV